MKRICLGINQYGYKVISRQGLTEHVYIIMHAGTLEVWVSIKNSLYNDVIVCTIDKSFDGILGVRFTNKVSGYSFVVFSCCLLPENSPWGRDSTAYFGHLLSQLYV